MNDNSRKLVDADHLLPRVVKAPLGFSQHFAKLVRAVPQGVGAKDGAKPAYDARTLHGQIEVIVVPSLEPSNFLLELLAAMRALEWPKILVAIHGLKPLKAPIIAPEI